MVYAVPAGSLYREERSFAEVPVSIRVRPEAALRAAEAVPVNV